MGRVAHLLTDTVTLAHETSVDSYGDPQFSGDQVEITARYEETTGLVVSSAGDERDYAGIVISESEIKTTDRLWPPGADTDDDNEARRVLKVDHTRFPGETDGIYEAYLS
jgi:hypothetical protein